MNLINAYFRHKIKTILPQDLLNVVYKYLKPLSFIIDRNTQFIGGVSSLIVHDDKLVVVGFSGFNDKQTLCRKVEKNFKVLNLSTHDGFSILESSSMTTIDMCVHENRLYSMSASEIKVWDMTTTPFHLVATLPTNVRKNGRGIVVHLNKLIATFSSGDLKAWDITTLVDCFISPPVWDFTKIIVHRDKLYTAGHHTTPQEGCYSVIAEHDSEDYSRLYTMRLPVGSTGHVLTCAVTAVTAHGSNLFASRRNDICAFCLDTYTLLYTLPCYTGCSNAMAVLGDRLLCTGGPSAIKVIDLDTKEVRTTRPARKDNNYRWVTAMVAHSGRLYTGNDDGRVRVWEDLLDDKLAFIGVG